MVKEQLPKEIVSLIHHVKLNEEDWWEKAINRIIISVFWMKNYHPLSSEEIQKILRDSYNFSLHTNDLDNQLQRLISDMTLVKHSSNKFKLSENSRKKYAGEIEEHQKIESIVIGKFKTILLECCPSLDPDQTWSEFYEKLLNPLVKELGVTTYDLLSGKKGSLNSSLKYAEFLNSYPEDVVQKLKIVLQKFIDPDDEYIRAFFLRHLNAFLFIEAGNMSKETVEALGEIRKDQINLNLFLDTNFLFSILELHNNPSNEAAKSLLNLVNKISNKVKIKFFVTNITKDEAINVIDFNSNKLKNIKLTDNIVNSIREEDLSGFAQKFFDDYKNSDGRLNVKDYFDPYLNNFITVIRSRGIEFHNSNQSKYKTDQNVIDDILNRSEFEKERYPDPKSYEKLEHDICLWHFVKDKRPDDIDIIHNISNWIVTVDYRFLGFDKHKQSNGETELPVCIHPTTLIQLLQIWVPRDKEFEKAIIGNLRLPLLFSEFDVESESITLKILETISRYKNVEDLPQSTITDILYDKVLRQKISHIDDNDELLTEVNFAIVEKNKESQKLINELNKEVSSSKEQIQNKDEIISTLKSEIQVKEKEKSQTKNHLESSEEEKKKTEKEMEQVISDNKHLSGEVERLKIQMKTFSEQKMRRSFIVQYIVGPLFLNIIISLIYSIINPLKFNIPVTINFLSLFVPLLIINIFVIDKLKRQDKLLSDYALLVKIKKLKNKISGFLGALFIGLIIEIIIQEITGQSILKKIGKLILNIF